MPKSLKIILSLTLALSVSACASYYGAARITSAPAGAEVININDGTVLGITPVTVWWKKDDSVRQHVTLRLRKDGYYGKVVPFWLSMRHKSQAEAMQAPQSVEASMQEREN